MHIAKNDRTQREIDKSTILRRDFDSFSNWQAKLREKKKKIDDLNNMLKDFDLS